jgi:hypothetical protein
MINSVTFNDPHYVISPEDRTLHEEYCEGFGVLISSCHEEFFILG